MKNHQRLQQLLDIYLNKDMSEVEKAELLSYFNNPVFLAEIEERLGHEYDMEKGIYSLNEIQEDQLLQNIFQYSQGQRNTIKTWKLWHRIAVAAAITVVLFGTGLFYYNLNLSKEQSKQVVYRNDVSPGKIGATLTLANGRKIRLTDAGNGELAKEAGVTVRKSANGQLIYEIAAKRLPDDPNSSLPGVPSKQAYNTLSTAKGETYQVRLPDGSLVWLNAASSLTYAANLNERGRRWVKLNGEGYFEIAKDKVRPFIVESMGQVVEVLGTHFNINSYPDQKNVKTTLLEGSIKISSNSENKLIKPGQQSLIIGGRIHVKDVIVDDAIAWKNGYFMFDNESLEDIMIKISRWYNVEIIYDDQSVKAETFFGTMSRHENISKILNMLERTGVVRFNIDGNFIRVARKK